MSSNVEKMAAAVIGPHPGSATATDTRPPQHIADTGTTEATVEHGLIVGRMATLLVGAEPVRFRLASAAGLSTQVATTDPSLPAYGRHDWLVEAGTRFPYLEAEDGSSAYEAWAFTSSQ